jgi:hypothetical protein
MFDKKTYHRFGCYCLDCHKVGCCCDYHLGRVGVSECIKMARQKNIYSKGFCDGREEAFEEIGKEILRILTMQHSGIRPESDFENGYTKAYENMRAYLSRKNLTK